MALSDLGLTDALLQYLHQDMKKLEMWILKESNIPQEEGWVTLKKDTNNKRLQMTVHKKAQDGSKLFERDYAIRIETVNN